MPRISSCIFFRHVQVMIRAVARATSRQSTTNILLATTALVPATILLATNILVSATGLPDTDIKREICCLVGQW
jgi:hypothetical protein